MFTEIASDSVTYVLYIGTIVLLFSVSNPPSLPYNILSFKFEFKTCLFSDDSRFFVNYLFDFLLLSLRQCLYIRLRDNQMGSIFGST